MGKFAIFVDGTPFVLYAPVTLNHFFMSPEDYYERWRIGSLLRILRYFSAFMALFFPAIYIALVEYHQGMIPSKLAFSIAGSRAGLPFPAVIKQEASFHVICPVDRGQITWKLALLIYGNYNYNRDEYPTTITL